MNNQSLRARLGIDKNYPMASRIISDALEAKGDKERKILMVAQGVTIYTLLGAI